MISNTTDMKIGQKAPDFTLPNQDGEPIHLADYIGKQAVVVFFYPKASSPGCTVEACTFRDQHEAFVDAGAIVFGVSRDDKVAQSRFKHRNEFPFDLLSDEDGKVHKAYDVDNIMGILPSRITYVIDKEGKVQLISDSNIFMSKHAREALETVEKISKQ